MLKYKEKEKVFDLWTVSVVILGIITAVFLAFFISQKTAWAYYNDLDFESESIGVLPNPPYEIWSTFVSFSVVASTTPLSGCYDNSDKCIRYTGINVPAFHYDDVNLASAITLSLYAWIPATKGPPRPIIWNDEEGDEYGISLNSYMGTDNGYIKREEWMRIICEFNVLTSAQERCRWIEVDNGYVSEWTEWSNYTSWDDYNLNGIGVANLAGNTYTVIDKIEYWNGTTDIDPIDTDDNSSILVWSDYQKCIIGQSCYFRLTYTNDFIGDEFNLIFDDDLIEYHPSQASTTLTYDVDNSVNMLVLEATTTPSSFNYCLIHTKYSIPQGNFEYCGITIDWVELTYEDELWALYNEDVCSDIASSTGIFGSFKSDMECALKKAIHWAMVPHPKYYINFQNSVSSLKKEFPLNIWGQINTVFSGYATTTATSSAIISLDGGGFGNIFSTGAEIDLSDIEGSPLEVFYDKFREFLIILLYGLLIAYFIARFFMIAHKKAE